MELLKVTKELVRILKPLVGKSPHHLLNIQDFIEQSKNMTLGTGDYITSYNITALFTSVPVEPAIG